MKTLLEDGGFQLYTSAEKCSKVSGCYRNAILLAIYNKQQSEERRADKVQHLIQ